MVLHISGTLEAAAGFLSANGLPGGALSGALSGAVANGFNGNGAAPAPVKVVKKHLPGPLRWEEMLGFMVVLWG